MPNFKDEKGREWDVTITVATMKRLKADGYPFLELAENNYAKLLEMERNDEALMAFLWALVSPQAEKIGVSQAEFDESLMGPSLQAAWEAAASAYANFSRDPKIRSSLLQSVEASSKLHARAVEAIKGKMSRMERLFQERLEKAEADMTDEKMRRLIEAQLPGSLN